jgi:alkaline phosphatase D
MVLTLTIPFHRQQGAVMSHIPVLPDRRRFLAAASLTLGVLALRGFPVQAAAAVHFTHGVASGDPLADRVILWTRVLPGDGRAQALDVHWEIALDEEFAQKVTSGTTDTSAARDYTVKVDAAGLQPGTAYFYRFSAQGVHSAVGRTRTLASAGAQQLRFAVVSCSNYPQGFFHVYREIASAELDAVLHLGDYIYEYADGGYANPLMLEQGRHVSPLHEIVSLEDYRTRYGLYRTDPDLQAVHQAHPFICVWDDHEIANNTWKEGAENHNPQEGEFAARRLAAIQAFHEWLPIREQASLEEGIIYRSFDFGDLASLIMLDTRLVGRDEQLSHDMNIDTLRSALASRTRSIMGGAQEAWLEQELARSAAAGIPWQLLGQQLLMGKLNVPQFADEAFDPAQRDAVLSGRYGLLRTRSQQGLPFNLDAWDGYPANRARALEAFATQAANVVVLAGDTHSSWAFNLARDNGEPVAVEIGTPSVTSPGFENFLPLPEAQVVEATMQASPELVYMKPLGRGWVALDVTRERVSASWHFVSTVTQTEYVVSAGARLEVMAGEHILRA